MDYCLKLVPTTIAAGKQWHRSRQWGSGGGRGCKGTSDVEAVGDRQLTPCHLSSLLNPSLCLPPSASASPASPSPTVLFPLPSHFPTALLLPPGGSAVPQSLFPLLPPPPLTLAPALAGSIYAAVWGMEQCPSLARSGAELKHLLQSQARMGMEPAGSGARVSGMVAAAVEAVG